MAAHHNLSEYQFRYRPTGPQTSYPGYDNDVEDFEENGWTLYDHSVEAIHKPTKRIIGDMQYDSDGTLFMIGVDEDHQRKGVATGMVQHANSVASASKQRIPAIKRAYHETPDGEAFADSMVKRGLIED